jgi:hypothetical protein
MRMKATIEVEFEAHENLDDIVLRSALFRGVTELEKGIKQGVLAKTNQRRALQSNFSESRMTYEANAYVDTIFDIQLKLGFTGSEDCWEHTYVTPENCDPQYGLMGIGQTDAEGRFRPILLQIKILEGAVLYSGCPIDFGTLSTDEGTFMDVFARACLQGCSEDQECEIADLIENMVLFTNPAAILGHMRSAHLYEIGDTGVDIYETSLRPEEVNCYAARRLASINPIPVPQQQNFDAFFDGIITGSLAEYQFDERLKMGILVYGIDGNSR